MRIAFALALALPLAGCGSKPPTAELVSWRVTREPLPDVVQGTIRLKADTDTFLVARVRGTDTGLYIRTDKDSALYGMESDDFKLTGPDGATGSVVGHRNPAPAQGFAGSSYLKKPQKEEEVEVAFTIPARLANRGDWVLKYRDLPPLTLDPAKKGK